MSGWSGSTFRDVQACTQAVRSRLVELEALLAQGEAEADPYSVAQAGKRIEDVMAAWWCPVCWDLEPDQLLEVWPQYHELAVEKLSDAAERHVRGR